MHGNKNMIGPSVTEMVTNSYHTAYLVEMLRGNVEYKADLYVPISCNCRYFLYLRLRVVYFSTVKITGKYFFGDVVQYVDRVLLYFAIYVHYGVRLTGDHRVCILAEKRYLTNAINLPISMPYGYSE